MNEEQVAGAIIKLQTQMENMNEKMITLTVGQEKGFSSMQHCLEQAQKMHDESFRRIESEIKDRIRCSDENQARIERQSKERDEAERINIVELQTWKTTLEKANVVENMSNLKGQVKTMIIVVAIFWGLLQFIMSNWDKISKTF